jgi:ferredoxin
VTFEPEGVTVEVSPGSTLLEAAHAAGVAIDAPCGGVGRCGSCRVRAEGGLTPLSRDEQELLGGAGVAAGKRLACRARVNGPVTVTLGAASGETRVVTESTDMGDLAVEPPGVRGSSGVRTATTSSARSPTSARPRSQSRSSTSRTAMSWEARAC